MNKIFIHEEEVILIVMLLNIQQLRFYYKRSFFMVWGSYPVVLRISPESVWGTLCLTRSSTKVVSTQSKNPITPILSLWPLKIILIAQKFIIGDMKLFVVDTILVFLCSQILQALGAQKDCGRTFTVACRGNRERRSVLCMYWTCEKKPGQRMCCSSLS